MKRKEVLEIIEEVGLNSQGIQEAIEEKVAEVVTATDKDEADIKLNVSRFLAKFRQKYNKHNRMLARFVERRMNGWRVICTNLLAGLLLLDLGGLTFPGMKLLIGPKEEKFRI